MLYMCCMCCGHVYIILYNCIELQDMDVVVMCIIILYHFLNIPGCRTYPEADECVLGQGVQTDPLSGGGTRDVRLRRLPLRPL